MARKPVSQATRRLFAATVESLDSLAPPDWEIEIGRRSDDGGVIRVTSTDDVSGELTVIVRRDLTPREVVALPEPEVDTIIAGEWLSPRSRELLEDIGYGYVDQTGNVSAVVKRPGIVFRTEGAQRDPSPPTVPRLNIRGPRAWALLRTLAEVQPPYGVSELSNAIDADAGYVSRLLSALTDELLISRVPRGPVEHVEWESLLGQITRRLLVARFQRDDQLDRVRRARTVPRRSRREQHEAMGHHRIVRCLAAGVCRRARDRSRLRRGP